MMLWKEGDTSIAILPPTALARSFGQFFFQQHHAQQQQQCSGGAALGEPGACYAPSAGGAQWRRSYPALWPVASGTPQGTRSFMQQLQEQQQHNIARRLSPSPPPEWDVVGQRWGVGGGDVRDLMDMPFEDFQ
eukprot:TRINITY_DN11643_c0_g1_i3.p4 TRINITY_DN11643_c0_g1~~TRINITY_DN11643_c0_g1_i3.p4  ORF type:complete len:133 (+),score=35.45 TRINITY_DN11643_c0_g1_i3:381-779(+)